MRCLITLLLLIAASCTTVCDLHLRGGTVVQLMGAVDAEVSCDPFRIEMRSGVASVALGDGRRIDVPRGAALVVADDDDGTWSWWTDAGTAMLRGAESRLFVGSRDAPLVVGNSPL